MYLVGLEGRWLGRGIISRLVLMGTGVCVLFVVVLERDIFVYF